jgi:hypothetical protein
MRIPWRWRLFLACLGVGALTLCFWGFVMSARMPLPLPFDVLFVLVCICSGVVGVAACHDAVVGRLDLRE